MRAAGGELAHARQTDPVRTTGHQRSAPRKILGSHGAPILRAAPARRAFLVPAPAACGAGDGALLMSRIIPRVTAGCKHPRPPFSKAKQLRNFRDESCK